SHKNLDPVQALQPRPGEDLPPAGQDWGPRPPPQTPAPLQGQGGGGWATGGPGLVGSLLQQRPDELGEAVPGPIEAALYGAEVAARDIGDLGVALAFQLAEHEDGPVVSG